jgi:hypothetical protein
MKETTRKTSDASMWENKTKIDGEVCGEVIAVLKNHTTSDNTLLHSADSV